MKIEADFLGVEERESVQGREMNVDWVSIKCIPTDRDSVNQYEREISMVQ